jgi:large subunit ribosomal protein L28
MAYKCEICGKRRRVANNVSHSNIKTKRTQRPNLHRVRALVNGQKVRILVCTRCLRGNKIVKAV